MEKLEEIREAAKLLLPNLENPALLLCLLSDIPSLSSFTIHEVEIFLLRLQASCGIEKETADTSTAVQQDKFGM